MNLLHCSNAVLTSSSASCINLLAIAYNPSEPYLFNSSLKLISLSISVNNYSTPSLLTHCIDILSL